jgi:hypothetical protein
MTGEDVILDRVLFPMICVPRRMFGLQRIEFLPGKTATRL